MKFPPKNQPPPACVEPKPPEDAATGLPWPTTWPGVYVFVFASFVVWVVLLAALAKS
jgi:hypothetical protein